MKNKNYALLYSILKINFIHTFYFPHFILNNILYRFTCVRNAEKYILCPFEELYSQKMKLWVQHAIKRIFFF